MFLYLLATAIIICITIGDVYVFVKIGKTALKAQSESLYIGAYLYLFVTFLALFLFQGEFQKLMGSEITFWPWVIAPFILGIFIGLFIFKKDISEIKNRK